MAIEATQKMRIGLDILFLCAWPYGTTIVSPAFK